MRDNPSSGRGWFNLGWALHHSERFEDGIAAFQKAVSLGFRTGTSTYNIACGNAMLNRTDAAMAALEAALESGVLHHELLAHDNDLDNLRDDARFQALADKLEVDKEAKHAEKMEQKMRIKAEQKAKRDDRNYD